MRLLSRDIDGRTGGGTVALLPEEGEDMWHLFNLIAVGDTVSAVTLRRVQVRFLASIDCGLLQFRERRRGGSDPSNNPLLRGRVNLSLNRRRVPCLDAERVCNRFHRWKGSKEADTGDRGHQRGL